MNTQELSWEVARFQNRTGCGEELGEFCVRHEMDIRLIDENGVKLFRIVHNDPWDDFVIEEEGIYLFSGEEGFDEIVKDFDLQFDY